MKTNHPRKNASSRSRVPGNRRLEEASGENEDIFFSHYLLHCITLLSVLYGRTIHFDIAITI